MDSPERSSRSYARRDREDSSDLKSDNEDWEATDSSKKSKHKSSKSRKPSIVEESEGVEGSGGRRRSSGDRPEAGRKRSGASSRPDSDEDDYDIENRKQQSRKHVKRKQEESSLEKLSSWYQEGELESSRQDGGDKSSAGKQLLEQDGSRGSKSKEDRSHDRERRESSRDRGHGSSEPSRNSRRRWDESDSSRKTEENSYERPEQRSGKASDLKYESAREKAGSARNEPTEIKSSGPDSNNDKGVKSNSRGERRLDVDKGKSKGRSEAVEEDNRGSPLNREDRSGREKTEKLRQQRTPSGRDVAESRERTSNADEDGMTWMRDKNSRELGQPNRSRTPERTSRRYQESEHSEMDHERSVEGKQKEIERIDRSKSRDDNWNDRTWDREGSKESWKRRQLSKNDKESKDGDIVHDRGREWDLPRHGRDRNENERPHGRSGRKDGNRGEAVKTSSNFGISNDNYDVIEIQTKPLDYGRAESGSNFPRRSEVGQQGDMKSAPNEEEWAYMRDNRGRRSDMYGSGPLDEDSRDKYTEDSNLRDPNSWNDDLDYGGGKGRGQKVAASGRGIAGQSSSGGSQPPYGNQDPVSFGQAPSQGVKGGRMGRGGRGRPTGRDNQQVGLQLPMMGSPFTHLGMPPPGPMQPINPNMSPAPGPPISPGVFIPPFSPPLVWPGPRAVDMNMLGVPPVLSPVPPGPSGPRFPPNMGALPNPGMFFNQSGPGRGPSNVSLSGFNVAGPAGRGTPPERTSGGWVPPRTGGPPGKAPSRGEQNDYSQNFVDTGMRPQNFIRELELTNVVEDYPKLRELIQKKDEIVANSASPPMYMKCDLREFELSPDFFGTKFDVILIDPPWEEYVHRAPGVADHIEYWKFEEIMNLKIEAIADTPSFIFLWVGDGVGLEQGRQCLKKWGFRRCEDICWVKTNKTNATPGLRHDSHTIFQHSKEHCLMGIKGTVRRSTDGHIIHANIDTDVIIAEEPTYGSTQKPEDMYRIIEHFALGRRRLELFGEDHNIRAGWLTVGKGLSSSNFNAQAYIKNFADKDGKVWQGGGGRNPPPEAPHLVKTTPEIESLRPKSPMKNQQQMQQQSASISLTNSNSSNRRPTGNSPQNPIAPGLNQEGMNMSSDDRMFDMYGYGGQANREYLDF
ncbi:MT-A70-like protein [Corchorus capsularis]|uniref:MT-A70-like protein n=1 Tax=Corchorus capsularis TaxID=210143 RepID=A0A1R3KX64_COCAP|nr:MT-A70-like protein [Corchorus capsularis]